MSSKPRQPAANKPPTHLSRDASRWWQQVVAAYDLEPHHLRQLQCAAEAWDRMVQARQVLDRDGLTYADFRGQPKPRPEIAIERDSRIAFMRALRELSLDAESGPAETRLPRGQRYA